MAEYVNPFGGGSKKPPPKPTTKGSKKTAPGEYVNPFGAKAAATKPGHAAKVDNSPLGILKQAGSAVGGLAKGIGNLGVEAWRMGGMPSPILHPKESEKYVAEKLPIMSQMVQSPIRTARTLNPRELLDPTMPWRETQLGKRVKEEGVVGTALATAADVSIFAGGLGAVGKAAGAGRLAKAAKLEEVAGASAKAGGLSRTANLATVETAARAAETAGNVKRATGLHQAARQLREAKALRDLGPATRAERATAFADTVKSAGAHVAASPAKPYQWAARGVGKLIPQAIGTRAGAAVTRLKQSKWFRDTHHEDVTAPQAEALYEMIESKHKLGDSIKHLDTDHQAALIIRRAGIGADSAFRKLYDEMDPDGRIALIEAAVPGMDGTKAFDIVRQWDEGTLDPKVAGHMDQAAERLDAVYAEKQAAYVSGKGTKADLSERGLEARRQRAAGQSADMDVGLLTEDLQKGTRARMARNEAEAAKVRMAVGDPSLTAPRTAHQERQTGTFAERVRAAQPGRPTARAEGAAADLAGRQGDANVRRAQGAQEHRLRTLDARRERDVGRLDELAEKAKNDISTAPPQDRPALRANQVAVEFAQSLAKANPESAHMYLSLADELATTTKELRAKGIIPEYSIGGKKIEGQGPVMSTGGAALRGRKTTASERARVSGRLHLDIAGQVEALAKEGRTMLVNKFARTTQETLGSTARETMGDVKLSGEALDAALLENGFQAWDPKGSGGKLSGDKVTMDSAVVPRALFDKFTAYTKSANEHSLGFKTLRAYDKATGAWKSTVLALSPRWQLGNVMGNTVLSIVGAGISPIKLAAGWAQAARMMHRGEGVTALRARGFHAPDLAAASLKSGGSKLRRAGRAVIDKSYRLNSYVDDVNRTAIYLVEKGKGLSDEAAVKSALRSAGDFSRMTPTERNVIRRIVPFYAWQKHITTLAFRLPLENPMRVAWTLHLAEVSGRVVDDPGSENEFNESTIASGENRLNLRSFDPFGSSLLLGGITDLDSINRSVGYSMNPILKASVAAATGLSPNRGLQPVRTPEAEYGAAAEPTFGLRHPVRMAQLAAQSVPQTRQIQDFVAGTAPVRVETGQPDAKGRTTGRGRMAQLWRFLGLPMPEPEQKSKKKKSR